MATFFALVLASGFCVSLVAVRIWHSGGEGYRFLVWNLVLAWIPFLLALAVYDGYRRRWPRPLLLLLGALWLLFLPNAPYIVTDFLHVGQLPGAPLWYDAGMIAAFACTGLLLGLGSLLLVQAVVLRAARLWIGWAMLAPVLALCSTGIVIGRLVRLNSWDALVRPGRVIALVGPRLANPLAHGRALVLTVFVTGFLALAYLLLYTLASLRPELERER